VAFLEADEVASTHQNRGRALELLGLFPDFGIEETDAHEIVKLMAEELKAGTIDFKKRLVGPGVSIPQLDHIHAQEGKTLEQVSRETKRNKPQ
jgi:hypothetical protein